MSVVSRCHLLPVCLGKTGAEVFKDHPGVLESTAAVPGVSARVPGEGFGRAPPPSAGTRRERVTHEPLAEKEEQEISSQLL